jgi:hypothetical protein
MPQWEEIQVRARKLIDEAFKLLRTGMTDAEYLAEATANAAKLHMAIRRNRLDKYRLLHDLGEEVCDAAGRDPEARQLRLTESMAGKIGRSRALDEEAKRAEDHITQLTVVRKPKSPVARKGDDDADSGPRDEGESCD